MMQSSKDNISITKQFLRVCKQRKTTFLNIIEKTTFLKKLRPKITSNYMLLAVKY
jgi:hypothetical protein